MATPDVTAGTIMDGSRALLNDQEAQIYTDVNLLSYLKTAFRELREYLEESNIPVTNKVDSVLSIDAGTTVVSFTSTPPLPDDLVEIQRVWYRTVDTDPWYPLTRREFVPPQLEGIEYTGFTFWAWVNNELHLLPSSSDLDIKLEYIQQVSEPTDENSNIGIINGQSFLEARCAALAARYMMENPERAQDLDAVSQMALDRTINIENKAKQSIFVRRRPFRAGWKSRTQF
jgi:hypothetical protein